MDMEKERSTGLGHGRMLSPSARFPGFSSVVISFGGRGETSRSVAPAPMLAMPELGRFRQEFSFGSRQFSQDLSKMMDVPHMNGGHRRAQSDLPCLPNKVRFGSSPNAVGAFDGPELFEENVNENGEDLIAMYMDMDKLNPSLGFYGLEGVGESAQATPQAPPYSNENMMVSPSQKPIVKHQQSLSFDGLTSTKPELLISSPKWTLSPESRKALSAAKLAEIALVNPKRAKR